MANTFTLISTITVGSGGAGVDAIVGLWRATPAAITSIKLFGANGYNFNSGTTMSLYGIVAA